MRKQVNGILLLDKPTEMTSNGALQRVKRLFNAKKAGHTGSLDPIATGMLPLCFGEATKFSQFLLDSDKSYYVTAKLGVQTTTGDSEGSIIAEQTTNHITREAFEKGMQQFLGEIEQIPPMYSAIKYNGQPLYKLARQDIEVERKPRKITIYNLKLEQFSPQQFSFNVHCSKGTYVRTLVEDIARLFNVGAHVIELRRTYVNPYGNARMYSMAELEAIAQTTGHEGLLTCLLPVETSVQIFPAIRLSTSAAFYLRMGQPVRTSLTSHSHLVRLMSEDERFIGMGEVLVDGRVKPYRLVGNEALRS